MRNQFTPVNFMDLLYCGWNAIHCGLCTFTSYYFLTYRLHIEDLCATSDKQQALTVFLCFAFISILRRSNTVHLQLVTSQSAIKETFSFTRQLAVIYQHCRFIEVNVSSCKRRFVNRFLLTPQIESNAPIDCLESAALCKHYLLKSAVQKFARARSPPPFAARKLQSIHLYIVFFQRNSNDSFRAGLVSVDSH